MTRALLISQMQRDFMQEHTELTSQEVFWNKQTLKLAALTYGMTISPMLQSNYITQMYPHEETEDQVAHQPYSVKI